MLFYEFDDNFEITKINRIRNICGSRPTSLITFLINHFDSLA